MKYLIALAIIVMVGCYDGSRIEKESKIGTINARHFTESGMHYVIFNNNDSRGGIFVVNITKDSLEVQKLIGEIEPLFWGLPVDSSEIKIRKH